MNRRQYLTLAGTSLSIGIAGCTDRIPGMGPVSEETMVSTYREALQEQGLDVTHVEVLEEQLVADFETHTTSQHDLLQEIETAALAYAEVVEKSWSVEMAEVWILDPDGEEIEDETIGSFVVANDWAFEWQDGGIDDGEVMNRVLDSLELYPAFDNRYRDGD